MFGPPAINGTMILNSRLATSVNFSFSNVVINNPKFGGLIAAEAHKVIGLSWPHSAFFK